MSVAEVGSRLPEAPALERNYMDRKSDDSSHTENKSKRVALKIIATLAKIASVAVIACAIMGVIPGIAALSAIPLWLIGVKASKNARFT